MPQTFKGAATIHGLVDIGTISGSTLPAYLEPTDASFDRAGDNYDIRDRTGARVGVVFYDTRDTATITMVIKASTLANMTTGGLLNQLNPGAKITFTPSGSATSPDVWAPSGANHWLLMGYSIAQSNTDSVKVTLQVEKSPGITSYDNVT